MHLIVQFADSAIFDELVQFLSEHQKEEEYLDPSCVVDELVQAGKNSQAREVNKACRGAQGTISHCIL